MESIALSVVILSYQNAPLLRLCLRSLSQALERTSLRFEIIVVDNATTPETANVVLHDFASVFETIRLIPLGQNTGYTHGVNEGLRASRGHYILSLNHDITVLNDTIELMIDYLKNNPAVGLLGPQLMNLDGTHQDSCFRFYTPLAIVARRLYLPFTQRYLDRFAYHDLKLNQPTQAGWVSGAAFMVRREDVQRIGVLDEQFFHYCSDVDWSRRFWENGSAVVYFPLASLYHGLGRASKGRFGLLDPLLNQATRWHIKDAITYFTKHGISGKRPVTATA